MDVYLGQPCSGVAMGSGVKEGTQKYVKIVCRNTKIHANNTVNATAQSRCQTVCSSKVN